MPNLITEDQIEQGLLGRLATASGWTTMNCFTANPPNVALKSAYADNLTNYRHGIPQLFLCNAFCVLSNALETRVGSMTAEWEHFFTWLRADDEKEKIDRAQIRESGTRLERLIDGLLQPARLLDDVENFILTDYASRGHKWAA